MTRNLADPKSHHLSSKNQLLKIPRKLISSLNLILDPAVIVDLEGNLLATNNSLCETTGFRKDELVGENLSRTDFVSPKNRICLMRKCLETAEKSDVNTFEIEVEKKNGEKMYTEVMTKKIECGKKAAELIVFHDVTDRRNREKALMESEEQYRSLCEDARILMLTSDLKGNICFANKIAETYGFIQDDVIGKNMADFVSKKNRPKLVSTHLNVVSGKKVEEEIEIITSNGVFIVDYVSSPIRKEGRITGCHIAMIDITDKKQINKKLEDYSVSAAELREAYRRTR
ncbi:MAG: PAS domain-containing protein [Candidatus Bathyarchaeia archaeon]